MYSAQLEAGDRVLIETPGGGGWGIAQTPTPHLDPLPQNEGGEQYRHCEMRGILPGPLPAYSGAGVYQQ